MRFAYTIIYVADVPATVEFYERAFGATRKFVHESNLYAELVSGETTLAFAGEAMAEMNGIVIRPNRPGEPAAGVEVGFVTETPDAAFAHAVANGAVPLVEPTDKPWGQRVSYVRDCNGCLVEISSPMGA